MTSETIYGCPKCRSNTVYPAPATGPWECAVCRKRYIGPLPPMPSLASPPVPLPTPPADVDAALAAMTDARGALTDPRGGSVRAARAVASIEIALAHARRWQADAAAGDMSKSGSTRRDAR